MSYEPTPIRDNGPYADAAQAMRQYVAVTHGIPGETPQMCAMVIREALLMTDAGVSEPFEMEYLDAHQELHSDPVMAQLITGWIIRAHLAGIEKGRSPEGA